jgi:hypothetical protein
MSGAEVPALRHPKHNNTSFKPGESPWPGGKRSKGFRALKEAARERVPEAMAAADVALAFDPPNSVTYLFAKLIFEYAEGKPATIVKVEGDIELRVSEDMRKARARAQRMILEGVAAVVAEQEAEAAHCRELPE